jgi:hypothetical protein
MHWFKVIKFNLNQWSQVRGVLYFQSKDGNKNYLQLVRKTHTVEFEFFLANNAQRINLIRQLRAYRKKGLSVFMTNDEGTDMLLQSV